MAPVIVMFFFYQLNSIFLFEGEGIKEIEKRDKQFESFEFQGINIHIHTGYIPGFYIQQKET